MTELLSEIPAWGEIDMGSLHVVITQESFGLDIQTVTLSVRQLHVLIQAIEKFDESKRLAF